jgi:hypothetical protein
MNPDPNTLQASAKKGKVAAADVEDEDPEAAFHRQHLELERLVTAMELEEVPAHSSWQSITMRADRAQVLWKNVCPLLTERQRSKLEPRVQRVCQKAGEISCELAKNEPEDPVQKVFYKDEQSKKQASASNGDAKSAPAPVNVPLESAPKSNQSLGKTTKTTDNGIVAPPPSVQDLQKTQREQMESAISQMAAQMKDETTRIHTT